MIMIDGEIIIKGYRDIIDEEKGTRNVILVESG